MRPDQKGYNFEKKERRRLMVYKVGYCGQTADTPLLSRNNYCRKQAVALPVLLLATRILICPFVKYCIVCRIHTCGMITEFLVAVSLEELILRSHTERHETRGKLRAVQHLGRHLFIMGPRSHRLKTPP